MSRILLIATLSCAALWGQRYHAQVLVEGGGGPPKEPLIRPDIVRGIAPLCRILTVFGNGTVEYIPIQYLTDECPVTIFLKGYQTTHATLRDGAVIVLKREGDHEGATVSMTSLKAPEDARKAYQKASELMIDKKWAAAQKQLERAVGIYPDYALAWSGLGEVLVEQSRPDEARGAFEKSIAADPKYLKPYLQLARLALNQRRPEDALQITDKAIALKPVNYPGIYFYNAVANFNLKRLDAAEKSAREAVDSDLSHEIPRAENLLGMILLAGGDTGGALQHLKKYLEIDPKAGDAADVKQLIAKLEKTLIERAK